MQWFWWRQHDYGYIFVTLIVCLTTLLSKVVSFNDFFGVQGWGRDGDRDGTGTHIWTDRLFSENIILDIEIHYLHGINYLLKNEDTFNRV